MVEFIEHPQLGRSASTPTLISRPIPLRSPCVLCRVHECVNTCSSKPVRASIHGNSHMPPYTMAATSPRMMSVFAQDDAMLVRVYETSESSLPTDAAVVLEVHTGGLEWPCVHNMQQTLSVCHTTTQPLHHIAQLHFYGHSMASFI